MKRIKRYNNTFNRRIGISIIIGMCIAVGMALVYFPISIGKIMNNIEEEAVITLKNVSEQNIKILNKNIKEPQKVLAVLAKRFERDKKYNIEDIVDDLKMYAEVYDMYNMGVIDKNGICYTTLGDELDLKSYDYFTDGMEGKARVTDSYLTEDGKEMINIFTMPIYKDGEVEFVMTATYRSSDFTRMMNISSFDEHGESIVVTSEGALVTTIGNANKIGGEDGNYRQEIQNKIFQTLQSNLNNNIDEDIVYFNYDGKDYIGYCEPVGVNDWYLISYVVKNYLYNNIEMIKTTIYRGTIILYATSVIIILFSVRERKQYEERMMDVVYFDWLTGERNEEYLHTYFEHMSEKDKNKSFLVVMDIDKFKSVNMMYGSEMGDRLLKYVPTTFKDVLPEDEIFKYQADVFVAVLKGTSQKEILHKINKLEDRINQDVENKLVIPMKLYFGVCAFNEFRDLNSIYSNALIAKNTAKKKVSKSIRFFDKRDKDKLIENRRVEEDFVEALKDNQFEIWYQPKYNTKTKEIYGAEALVRWRKKDGSFVFPSIFIPVLENTGQIIQLDEEVIKMVFQDIQEMKRKGLPIKPISINLSRLQAINSELVNRIKTLMEEYEINPSEISFEITETALVEENALINKMIEDIHQLGIKVDIDDYGIGNSTLSGIFSSNFDTLKLDKTFCDHIGTSKMNTIIKATIKMAKDLKMTVIAEGVETLEQADFLRENNCNIIQGYYFSKPLIKKEYFDLMVVKAKMIEEDK